MNVVPISELLDDQIRPLVIASEVEGFCFVRRLVTEWSAGVNRFTGSGEALLGAFVENRLVGICGLMRDPYQDERRVARLRNLYVIPGQRSQGIGARLIRCVIERAASSFTCLRLRAVTAPAAALYEHLGFTATPEIEHCTHIMWFRPGEPGLRTQ